MSTSATDILVVDDEEPIREMLGWMLEDDGHMVRAASDGFQALDFLRTRRLVDIVLSDINMPGMDCLALSRRIKTEFPHVPVLLLSGRPPPAGVRAFIAKPFLSDTLAESSVNATSLRREQ